MTRVAMQFGFSPSQHFSGKFKQAFGLTPRAWLAVLARQAVAGVVE
jgi:AraC-like DNA-binding protein